MRSNAGLLRSKEETADKKREDLIPSLLEPNVQCFLEWIRPISFFILTILIQTFKDVRWQRSREFHNGWFRWVTIAWTSSFGVGFCHKHHLRIRITQKGNFRNGIWKQLEKTTRNHNAFHETLSAWTQGYAERCQDNISCHEKCRVWYGLHQEFYLETQRVWS